MTAMSLPTPIGRQREVLYLPAQGHVVALGTAGSGKTTLAILRSLYLADQSTDHGGRTLLVTFNRCLVTYMNHLALDGEQQRSVKEGLKEHELALFDLLTKDELAKAERERVKQASRELLASITARLSELDRFWEKEQTKAEIEVFILDEVYANLPTPPFTADEKKTAADAVYAHDLAAGRQR